jgi:hypothetical protein
LIFTVNSINDLQFTEEYLLNYTRGPRNKLDDNHKRATQKTLMVLKLENNVSAREEELIVEDKESFVSGLEQEWRRQS